MLTLKLFIILSPLVTFSKAIRIYPATREGLIWYNSSDPNSYAGYVSEIDDLLNQQNRIMNWSPCMSSSSYSFSSTNTGPCIFFSFPEKLKETPESYNSTTLPANAPDYLHSYIIGLEADRVRKTHNLAYITCNGTSPADEENIGPLHFLRNLEISILPYSALTTFTEDVIAVYFEKPMRYIVINVTCKIWANFKTLEDFEASVVTFDLLID
ncbi:hypothetical protein RN001_009235 [Aquatica leii]|uniref:Uncharacterized protein n=1 Tax=Aquatica leii TaxID=1421715 RepID=A0AAN7P4B2_9COLE|nr:hypothetical protein RN001_009235 [Aquatica leii]